MKKTTTLFVSSVVIGLLLFVFFYQPLILYKHDLRSSCIDSSRPKIHETTVFYRPVIPSTAESMHAMYGEGNFSEPSLLYRPVIPSTAESLYAMYGEGNFTDDDQHLLNYIRSMTSQQGPGGRQLYNPSRLEFSQYGGAQFVDKLLKQRRGGFFLECGAFGGEDLSDTLFFERERNWTGILIEANPEYHREILRKNRRALVLRACLHPRPGLFKFRLKGWGGGVSEMNKNVASEDKTTAETDVQCFSLNSIMAAIGVRHIDFMVLDVEGSELPVLESIDWTKLSIDVFSIEYNQLGPVRTMAKLNKVRDFFNRTGQIGPRYKEVGKLPLQAHESSAQDVIFMRK